MLVIWGAIIVVTCTAEQNVEGGSLIPHQNRNSKIYDKQTATIL